MTHIPNNPPLFKALQKRYNLIKCHLAYDGLNMEELEFLDILKSHTHAQEGENALLEFFKSKTNNTTYELGKNSINGIEHGSIKFDLSPDKKGFLSLPSVMMTDQYGGRQKGAFTSLDSYINCRTTPSSDIKLPRGVETVEYIPKTFESNHVGYGTKKELELIEALKLKLEDKIKKLPSKYKLFHHLDEKTESHSSNNIQYGQNKSPQIKHKSTIYRYFQPSSKTDSNRISQAGTIDLEINLYSGEQINDDTFYIETNLGHLLKVNANQSNMDDLIEYLTGSLRAPLQKEYEEEKERNKTTTPNPPIRQGKVYRI